MGLRDGFELGEWTVHPLEGSFINGDTLRRVQPKSMDVLLVLAEHATAVVERETLLSAVWGERAVSDEPLTRCIGELRRALGDTREEAGFIATIPKRGYRLLHEPVLLESDGEDVGLNPAQRQRRVDTLKKLGIGAAVLLLAAAVEVVFERVIDSPEMMPADEQSALLNSAPDRSVAVLPFLNMSPDPEQEYFADGVAEEILNSLSKIEGLIVTSRSSAFSFKDQDADIPTIAARLNVAHVLEGSVRRSGDTLRVTAQLIDARTDAHLWSQSFDTELEGIFEVQEGIAATVAEHLEVEILGRSNHGGSQDPDAYALYLKAKEAARRRTPEGFEQSNTLYQDALELDPEFADAWSGLAQNYRRETLINSRPFDEGYPLARATAQKAVAIDPDHAVALAQIGRIAIDYEDDLESAAGYLASAMRLEPANTDILSNAAVLAFGLARMDDAVKLGEHVVRRDPLNAAAHSNLGLYYLHSGSVDQAIASYRTALALTPNRTGAHYEIGVGLLLQAEPELALESFRKERDDEWNVKGRALAHHMLGNEERHAELLQELIDGWGERWPSEVAQVYAWSGDVDTAFEWLDKAIEIREAGLRVQHTNPLYSRIKGDVRWSEFRRRSKSAIGLLDAIEFSVDLDSLGV